MTAAEFFAKQTPAPERNLPDLTKKVENMGGYATIPEEALGA